MYYKTKPYKVFAVVNIAGLTVISLLCILPLIHVFAVSLSGKSAAAANIVNLWPIDMTFDAYKKTLDNRNFIHSLWVSVERTVLGTVISMFLVSIAAYALSKDHQVLRSRSIYMWYFVFTMLFNGGLVPNYMLISKLGLMNTLWALILPVAVSVWNMILLLNFFRALPKDLEESAFMDGAGQFKTLFMIYLPLSAPAIATLSLFMMVWHWNSWFDGMIYMPKVENYPLSTFLQTIIVQQDFSKANIRPEDMEAISNRTVKAAQIFIGALPILLVYPFLQRFFIKGIVLGAVKE